MSDTPAILLPGAVLPADLAYAALLDELGRPLDVRAKDLEVYAQDEPPDDFSLETEVIGVLRFAGEAGFDRFNVVGYSAGGAVALALAATHPSRVGSLALMEPAWAGRHGMSAEEAAAHERVRAALAIEDPDAAMRAFVRAQLAADVPSPPSPSGPRPTWMAKRPAGVSAFVRAFDEADLSSEALSAFKGPVWFAVGGLSDPDLYARKAERLAAIWPRMIVQVFPERHHFDPPHRVEAGRVAAALRELWGR